MITTVTLNPALDKTVYVDNLLANDANRIAHLEQDAGGKGVNASRMLKELGSDSVALGFVGGATGDFIEYVLAREGIETDFVHISTPTRTNIAVQESDGSPPTVLNEPGPSVSDVEMQQLMEKLGNAAARSFAVVFGGSVCSGVNRGIYQELIEHVRPTGALTVLDADGSALMQGLAATPYMIKPNIDEAARLCGVELQTEDQIARAARDICRSGIGFAVISMGKRGAIATTCDETWLAVPPRVKVISTIGSGDSMVAGILHILEKDGSVEDALRWGTAAGASTAMTNGVEIGRKRDILDLLDQVIVRRIEV